MAWDMVKLGDVSKFIRNGASIRQSTDASGLKITRIETISHRVVNLEKCGYANISDDEYLDYRLKKNDILISHINSEIHLGKCAIFLEDRNDIIHGMNLLLLRPNEKIFPIFLFYVLSSSEFLKQIVKITKKSVNQASFTVTAFKELQIPLPPLGEQKRIAATLDKAHNIRQKREQNLNNANALIKSIFLDMFGDPVTNPMGWGLENWQDVFNTTTGRLDANAMEENGLYPFFTCSKEIFAINKYAFDCEALLLAGNNAAGKYDVKYYNGKFNAYQRTYVLTLKNKNYSYLLYKYLLEDKLEHMRQHSRGTNTKYLTMTILDELKFLKIPEGLQSKFAEIVTQIEAQKAKQNQHLHDADQCFKALQQQFFG